MTLTERSKKGLYAVVALVAVVLIGFVVTWDIGTWKKALVSLALISLAAIAEFLVHSIPDAPPPPITKTFDLSNSTVVARDVTSTADQLATAKDSTLRVRDVHHDPGI